MIDVAEALKRERSFLERMSGAQEDYEWLITNEAWTALGHDSFADWWTVKVVPVMRALSMRPTREITAKGIEQVKKEEASLPRPQRRTQKEIGEMFGVSDDTAARSSATANAAGGDLATPRPRRPGRPIRRPLTEQARETGWSLRKDVERIQQILGDDRLAENKEQVTVHLVGHLQFAVEALAGALKLLTPQGE